MTVFACLNKDILIVKILYYLNLIWKTTMYLVIFSRDRTDNLTMTTSVCWESMFWICMVTRNWKKTLQKSSTFFSITARKELPQNFKVLTWTFFQKLKKKGSSRFFAGYSFRKRRLIVDFTRRKIQIFMKVSSSYITKITISMPATAKQYPENSDAVPVTSLFQRLVS